MDNGLFIIVLVVAIGVVLLLGLAIFAVLLRSAIALYNRLSGGDGRSTGVPEPRFLRAMGIGLILNIVNGIAGVAVGFVIGGAGVAGGMEQESAALLAQAAAIPVGTLVMSAVLAGLLPTSFRRAFLVVLCYLAISLTIAIAVGAVVVGVGRALG